MVKWSVDDIYDIKKDESVCNSCYSPILWVHVIWSKQLFIVICLVFLVLRFLSGHSTTTWIKFYPILTPTHPLRVDKNGHFTYYLPFVTWPPVDILLTPTSLFLFNKLLNDPPRCWGFFSSEFIAIQKLCLNLKCWVGEGKIVGSVRTYERHMNELLFKLFFKCHGQK